MGVLDKNREQEYEEIKRLIKGEMDFLENAAPVDAVKIKNSKAYMMGLLDGIKVKYSAG